MAGLALIGGKRGMGGAARTRGKIGPAFPVRLDPQVLAAELRMALIAEPCVMTARAGLWIVQRLDRMNLPEIGPVASGLIVGPVVRHIQLCVYAAALMTVKTELLTVAVGAVL